MLALRGGGGVVVSASGSVTLEDFPVEVRDAVRDFAEVFLAGVTSRDEITAESVGAALREERENPRGCDGYYSTHRNWVLARALREHLAGTYDEFREEMAR